MVLIALFSALTCERGGSAYWVTFFGGLPGGVDAATNLALAGAIGPGDVLATTLGLASGGVVIPGFLVQMQLQLQPQLAEQVGLQIGKKPIVMTVT